MTVAAYSIGASQGFLYLRGEYRYLLEPLEAVLERRRAAKLLGDLFWKVGDQKIIDGLGPDGVSAASYALGRRTGRLQTGYLYHYAFVMLLGVAGLLTFALWAWRA